MFWCNGLVNVRNGKSNGRSFNDQLTEGKITIKGVDGEGVPFERVVYCRDGQIWDNRLKVKGRTTHHIIYGQYERKSNGTLRFRKDSGKGLHGKSLTRETLLKKKGVCHSWYNRGRLIRQMFYYENGVKAYEYKAGGRQCVVSDHRGQEVYKIEGWLNGRLARDAVWCGGLCVFNGEMSTWMLRHHPFKVWHKGKLVLQGQENRYSQKIGEWYEKGQWYYYERGVAIPKKLYETPAEDIDVKATLKIDNAQLRMALLSRVSPERIALAGKIVDSDPRHDMRLYVIPGMETKILRVQCTTTKAYYYLNVPYDSNKPMTDQEKTLYETKCERARQWTFGVGQDFQQPIKFEIET